MTTIIGIQTDRGCLLAADSRVTTEKGRPAQHFSVSKISKLGRYLVAGAGMAQPCDVVQHCWKPPSISKSANKDPFHFAITELVPSLRELLNTHQIAVKSEEDGFELLVAFRGNLVEIDSDFNVSMRDDGMYGLGSGSDFAIGALLAGATWKRALQIAASNDVNTGPPFHVVRQMRD
jgi:ATP-dependent protease HslVU (ClpYQ) peptidase subunit